MRGRVDRIKIRVGKQGLCRQSKYSVGMMSIPWLPGRVYRGRRAKCKITRGPCEEMMTVNVNTRGRDCCTVPHSLGLSNSSL